ncbi:MAG: TIGR00282 family metallophosphoesterase [Alphaproteobacteria bacterium]|nr:TIGR00282 family metallophosphoesterase [Alphaproteobacteria bacterium]
MKLLFLGDIVGRSGRTAVVEQLPAIRKSLDLDFVVANGENAAGGIGITAEICQDLFRSGVDVITGGNHSWDQRQIMDYIDDEPRLLRPANFPAGTPGKGTGIYMARGGERVAIINVMGRIFMDPLDDPFAAVEDALGDFRLGQTADFILIDVHAEATSEKMAMGHFADGRASLVVGTHSHVPTADTQIFSGGTAYQTDAGMCGDYNSVIGMEIEEPLRRFTTKIPGGRFSAAQGEATLCGVMVETDDRTGLATHVGRLRRGGVLQDEWPIKAVLDETAPAG